MSLMNASSAAGFIVLVIPNVVSGLQRVAEGVRVIEFAHMVMGPSCGLVLADLGADVVKVEPLRGDNTRAASRRRGQASSGVQPQQEEPGRRILAQPEESASF